MVSVLDDIEKAVARILGERGVAGTRVSLVLRVMLPERGAYSSERKGIWRAQSAAERL
jgi:hypothetical protein